MGGRSIVPVVSRARVRGGRRDAVVVFLAVAVVVVAAVAFSDAVLPKAHHRTPPVLYPGQPWFDGWPRWDAFWYAHIARHGYSYVPGRQSSIVFFPAYPLAMRALGWLVGDVLLAGMLVTFAAGASAAVLFAQWARRWLPGPAARTALLLLLVSPYAYYLVGAVYSDALFLAAALGAFVVLERDRPVAAGLLGAVAVAARPVGPAVVLGLAVRALERRGALAPGLSLWRRRETLRARDAAVLVSALGLAAYAVYLWSRFGDPLAFVHDERAWGQPEGWHTWVKASLLRHRFTVRTVLHYGPHVALAVVALALVPAVFRRFGVGYGVYTLAVVGLPVLGTKDFFSMGRYVLAAFPAYAAAGELLASRPGLRRGVLVVSGAGLVVAAAAFAQGHYIA